MGNGRHQQPRRQEISNFLDAYASRHLGGIIYADQCSGNDIGARIMDCQNLLPSNSFGYKLGTIVLPNTSTEPAQRNWSTPVILGPGVNLTGQGMFASSFSCSAHAC